ncbi:MAG: transketolase C-terminal domain-containing protein, partial [Aquiluna sp.]
GMATAGKHPVVAVYATFLNRAIDQLLMDVALHRLGVTFVLDRSGITGPDGASHHGIWDLALLQAVPGIHIAAPRDAANLERALAEALEINDAPTVIRFPKGPIPDHAPAVGQLENGSELLRKAEGKAILLIGLGPFAQLAIHVAEELDEHGASATVVDPRWVTPMPRDLLELASGYKLVATIEDGIVSGGVGESYAVQLARHGAAAKVINFGIPTQFVEHAERSELLAEFGLEPKAIAKAILRRMGSL